MRLYGEVGALTLSETVSNRTDVPPASEPTQDFDVTKSGVIEIAGPGGRRWEILATPDNRPSIAPAGEITREQGGEMNQPFTASDDYGVVAGQATIALDLPEVDRRYGLTVDPEPREPIVLDLPMPISGDRTAFTESLVDDLSKHPFANLPVTITLAATDAIGQTGEAAPIKVTLPGRRFFDPLAASLIETRRDLLWSTANAARSAQILKAVTFKPEGFIRNERAYLRLRVLMRRLDTAAAEGLQPAARDELADELWEIALLVEEGDLASALERLRRAQDRLDEAIQNGADKAEIDQLMSELRDALNEYMRQLAQEAENNPDQQMSENMQGMQMTGDQLQQMLDELQRAMEEGRMADAAEMMEALRQLMENMQVTQGEGGQGGPGQQAMRDLAETLRDQQELSDESFQELQDHSTTSRARTASRSTRPARAAGPAGATRAGTAAWPAAGPAGSGPGSAAGPGTGRHAAGQPLPRPAATGTARPPERPERLAGEGSEAGEAGRQQLDRAGRAMDEAEEALRNEDFAGALDRQAEALEALREGCATLATPWRRSRESRRTVRVPAKARRSAVPTPTVSAIRWAATSARWAASGRTATCCKGMTCTGARRSCWTRSAAARATSRARQRAGLSEAAARTVLSNWHGTPSTHGRPCNPVTGQPPCPLRSRSDRLADCRAASTPTRALSTAAT